MKLGLDPRADITKHGFEVGFWYTEKVLILEQSMPEPRYKWAYCPYCVNNVRHFRAITSQFFRIIDILTLGLTRLFRIGPWYCVHCEHKSIRLRRERRDMARLPTAGAVTTEEYSTDLDDDDSLGRPNRNFLKADHSLVMRSSRLKRFSEKYRDSIVRRLLSGNVTIGQIRQEKDISEGELIDWIADRMERMQAKLDALEETQNSTPALETIDDFPLDERGNSIPYGPTVEGKVKPK